MFKGILKFVIIKCLYNEMSFNILMKNQIKYVKWKYTTVCLMMGFEVLLLSCKSLMSFLHVCMCTHMDRDWCCFFVILELCSYAHFSRSSDSQHMSTFSTYQPVNLFVWLCAVAQTVGCWLLTSSLGFNLGNFMWDSWWMKWHWRTFFLGFFGFPPLIIISVVLHTHLTLLPEMCDSPEQAARYHILSL
jgi:hypothetical protein